MIDWDRVNELRDEIGEEDFAEVAEIFLEEVDEAIAQLPSVTGAPALADAFHFLKGSALNLGFQELSRLCHDAEKAAIDGSPDATHAAHVIGAYSASKTAFVASLG